MERRPIRVTYISNPFDALHCRKTTEHKPGQTIQQLFDAVDTHPIGYEFVAARNGKVVEPEEYNDVIKGDESIVFCPVPQGGGGGGKSPLRIILNIIVVVVAIVVAVYAPYTLPAWAGGFTINSGMAFAAVMAVGSLIVNMVAPITMDPMGNAASNNFSESPTYGWNVDKNTDKEGVPWPVLYGTCIIRPPIIGKYIDVASNLQYYNILFAVADHAVDEYDEYKFYLNGSLATINNDFLVETRTGSLTQAPCQYFGDTKYTKVVGEKLATDMSWTTTIQTDGNTNQALGVAITMPKGLYYANDTGGLTKTSVRINIDFKSTSTSTWSHMTTITSVSQTIGVGHWSAGYTTKGYYQDGIHDDSPWRSSYRWIEVENGGTSATAHTEGEKYEKTVTYYPGGAPYRMVYTWAWKTTYYTIPAGATTATITLSDATAQPIRRVFYAENLIPDQYDVRVRYAELPNTNVRYTNEVYFEYIEEIIYDDFSFPGASLLAVRALATEHLSGGLPDICFSATRSSISIWDSTASTYIHCRADNPAWASYDILHNKSYGCGIPYSQLDYSGFAAWATFCSTEGFTCNLYFDAGLSAQKALEIMSNLGRGGVVQYGNTFTCIVDKEETTPVQKFMFGMGNIVKDSYAEEFMDMDDRANCVEVTWYNNDQQGNRETIELHSMDYETTEQEIKRSSINLLGCTDRDMAIRHGRFSLNNNRFTTLTANWVADIDAIACLPFDVVEVSHDVPQYGYSGRIVSATGATVVLDRQVTMATGTDYVLNYQLKDDTRYNKTVAAVATPTTTATITMDASLATPPVQYDLYAFGQVDQVTKLFRIMRISRNDDLTRKIYAVEYNAEVYSDTGATIEAPATISDLSACQHLKVNEIWRGGSTTDVQLLWMGFSRNWYIKYCYTDGVFLSDWFELARTKENSYYAQGFDYGKTYYFNVSHTNSVLDGASATLEADGKYTLPDDVSGLIAEGVGDGVTFRWTANDDFDLDGYKIRTALQWASEKTCLTGLKVVPATTATVGTKIYNCIVEGISGLVEPTWPSAAGATITDGEAVWQEDTANWTWLKLHDIYHTRNLTSSETTQQSRDYLAISAWVVARDKFENLSSTVATATGYCLNRKPYLTVAPSYQQGDYTDIAKAVQRLGALGGSIFIKNGTYVLTDKIEVPNKNLDIAGESRGGVKIYGADYTDIWGINDLDNQVTFADMTLYPGTWGYGVNIAAGSGSFPKTYIRNVEIDCTTATESWGGIYITGTSNVEMLLDAMRITGGDYGIRKISQRQSPVEFLDSTGASWMDTTDMIWAGGLIADTWPVGEGSKYRIDIKNSDIVEQDLASISIGGGGKIYIYNNNIETECGGMGIYILSPLSAEISGNYISAATGDNGSYTGIYITGVELSGLKVGKNTIEASYDDVVFTGIAMSCDSTANRGPIITDNIIKFSGYQTASDNIGIYVNAAVNGQFSGNTIRIDNSQSTVDNYGMYLDDVDNSVITNNAINLINNTAQEIGIYLDANCDNNQGSNNLTEAVGTSISDDGAGNTVTAKDV